MLKKIILPVIVAALAAVLIPSEACAWGAAHVGYTHVGPNGVYHVGATEARGGYGGYGAAYGGAYRAGYGGAAYGGAYRAGYGGAYGGAAYGGYHYSAGYNGGAAYGGYRYGYVR